MIYAFRSKHSDIALLYAYRYNSSHSGVRCASRAEIIPAELRMKFQPDPDNTGGGRQ